MVWIALLIVLILFGFGFAVKALLWIALILLGLWLLGWLIRPGTGTGTRRWYYW